MDETERIEKVGIHNPTATIEMRIRLENLGEHRIYFYSYPNSLYPRGFSVENRDGKKYWLGTMKEGWLPESPGLRHHSRPGMAWIGLDEGSAIEWSVYEDSSEAGKQHAQSVLLKDSDDKVFETFTEYYQVPEGQTLKVTGVAVAVSATDSLTLYVKSFTGNVSAYFKLVDLDFSSDAALRSRIDSGQKVELLVRRNTTCDERIRDWNDQREIKRIGKGIDFDKDFLIACYKAVR
jgi:hypothetical protein